MCIDYITFMATSAAWHDGWYSGGVYSSTRDCRGLALQLSYYVILLMSDIEVYEELYSDI